MKKIPMRMCVVTHEKLPKKDLLRIVMTDEGVVADLTGKVNGHGCYIKKDIETLNQARKTKVLDKVLETTITDEVYNNIEELIK